MSKSVDRYKVISFDMFQTLVNVNERIPEIWKGILKEEYTKEKAEIGARAILKNLPEAYEKSIDPFLNMEEMFLICARNSMHELTFSINPKDVAYHLTYQHGYAPFYEEVLPVMKELAKKYTVILSSDSCHLMVDPLLAQCHVDRAFISDDLKCYKGDSSGKFFNQVLSQMKITPDQILHIGDSVTDMIGAHAAGIDFCWINREKKDWKLIEKPEYMIHNLNELFRNHTSIL